MKDAADAMRAATNDLRRQDTKQASASAAKAAEKLHELERQMQSGRPDEKRRALGEAQLEARQLADAQRQIASELRKSAPGEAGKDTVRRLAGEQSRVAERTRRLQDALKQQAGGDAGKEAGREIERQRLADRAQQSADAMRSAAERGPGTQRGSTGAQSPADEARAQAGAQDELARAFDKIADRIGSASGAPKDGDTKLSDQLTRAQELQQRVDTLAGRMNELGARGSTGSSGTGASGAGSGEAGRLRDEIQRAQQETRELMEQLRRDDPSSITSQRGGGIGATFEGQGMTTTSPGTEAFKQDFAKWDDLKHQMSLALEQAQTSIAKRLQEKQSKDRLAAGAEDKAPAEYQKQVDDYFKAIAAKKKGS